MMTYTSQPLTLRALCIYLLGLAFTAYMSNHPQVQFVQVQLVMKDVAAPLRSLMTRVVMSLLS